MLDSDYDATAEAQLRAALASDEEFKVRARARDGALVVTDRRVLVAANERLALDIPYEGLRRIQFDIERSRPATMVIVPEERQNEPQVLAIDPDEYESAAQALAIIGRRLAATQ